MNSPILVALDLESAEEAIRLATDLEPVVGGFKIGLELLMGPGPGTIGALVRLGKPVFVDAKLHDIPNTVRRASRQIGRAGARWLTVHASGGADQLEAAAEGLAEGAGVGEAGILAVTVLTSLTDGDLAQTGVTGTAGKQSARLAKLASSHGAEGVICSVKELGVIAEVAPSLVRVTPGIRPAGVGADDQKRVSTPEDAYARGADWLVIGRAITRADDPRASAELINESLTGDSVVYARSQLNRED
ncbi:MAG: orotidine-5'-phosphate decarboxylase [Acidimicrobiia bacterium]|nr:orotidine-5'-phosphate decarboxylase [Acidimicrobiia bacterium]